MKKLTLLIVFFATVFLPLAANDFLWSGSVRKVAAGRFRIEAQCRIAERSYLNAEFTSVTVFFADGKSEVIKPPPAVIKEESSIYPAGVCRWVMLTNEQPLKIQVEYQGCTEDLCLAPEDILLWQMERDGITEASEKPSLTSKYPSVSSKVPSNTPSLDAKLTDDLQKALDKFEYKGKLSGLPESMKALEDFLQQSSSGAGSSYAGNPAPAMGFWAILLLVVLGGMGLNLTPCVLPMIPVNLAIIGADAGSNGKFRGFRRGLAYGLGITLAYGVLGLLAALTGSRFGELNSSSVFNFIIAVVFVLLALGMFGVYELDFSRIGNWFRRNDSSGSKRSFPPEITAFGLGIAAALLAGACVAPVVITVILLAARLYSDGNIWGLALPFALGLSMALPWPLLGAGLSVLPRPGMWMVRVKQLFGVLILLMALYYGYLGWNLRSGAFDQSKEIARLAEQLNKAAVNKEVVLIDCWATWCKNCKALDKMLESKEGKALLNCSKVTLIRFQAEKINDPQVAAFLDKYQLPGLPSMILLKSR